MIDLRPVTTERDVEAYLDVRNRVEPADPVSREGFDTVRGRPDRLDLLALRDATPIGMGFARRSNENSESPYAFARVGVVHEARRCGVGTSIFRSLSAHASTLGCRGLTIEFRGDEADSLRYLGHRGFEKVFQADEIGLDLSTARVDVQRPAAVELSSLVDDGVDRRVYEAAVEIERDLPHIDAVTTPSFERWRTYSIGPDLLRACSFAATHDGVVVGLGLLLARPWGAVHGLTGVRAAYRRRGIARAIKLAQIEGARAAGLAELRTTNGIANAAIRQLNESLGYRALRSWITFRGPLIER